jgi:hypothetical protein
MVLPSCPGHFTPGKELPVSNAEEAGWAPEPVWAPWSIEKYFTFVENQSSPQSVATPTELEYLIVVYK